MQKEVRHRTSTSRFNEQATILNILGGFSLSGTDGRPIEIKARKSKLLLAYIAIPSGQSRSREKLASLLWNDRQDEQARGSLRTALSGIKRSIGANALIIEQDSIRTNPDYISSDYEALKSGAENGLIIEKLEEIYAGEFLEGLDHNSDQYFFWVREMRSECENLAISILENSAEKFASEGNTPAAINYMRESLAIEPLKEQSHRTIMQLYADIGERAMALAQYRTCKELLLHELDAEPDPDTKALADKIALRDISVSQKIHTQPTSTVENSISYVSVAGSISEDPNKSSIAVLPFVNMSGDAEQNYFADGITEDIITDLSEIDSLSVVAKNASQIYRGTKTPPAQISEELGVRYILDGSVRKAGDNVRISAQLIDTRSSRQIWGERYDRKLSNIFELQTEISQAIVSALEIKLVRSAQKTLDNRTTTSAEAYQYYLQGRALLREFSERGIELAKELFERAIALDENYALAYTGLADCATQLSNHYRKDENLVAEAKINCEKALSINPMLAEAYSSLGFIGLIESRYLESKDFLLKAIQLAPDLVDAYFYLGLTYLAIGKDIEQAYGAFKSAFDLDHQELRSGMMVLSCGTKLEDAVDLNYYANLTLRAATRRIELNPYDMGAHQILAYALFVLGRIDEAKHSASIASAFAMNDGRTVYNLACLQSELGAIDESLDLIERTLELGCSKGKVLFMKHTDPDLDNVRKDPRFNELLARYGY